MEPWQHILYNAAKHIKAKGLAKHTYCDAKGANCVLGAIKGSTTANDFRRLNADETLAMHKLQERIGFVVPWNDAPECTAQEVINTLLSVANGEPS